MNTIQLTCAACGASFDVVSKHYKPGRRYCTPACAGTASKEHLLPDILRLTEKGLSQAAISRRLKVSQAVISKMLNHTGPAYRLVFDRSTGAIVSSRGVDLALL